MEAASKQANGEGVALLDLFTALLRPLMPLALEYGISAKDVSDAVRRAYIEALEARMAAQDRPLSDARLALLAGLTRSEIALFRNRYRPITGVRRSEQHDHRIATVLSVWNTHPRFSGAYGLALDLDIHPIPGSPRRSFVELVNEASPDFDPDGVLDELIAHGSAEIVDQTTVRCRSRTVVLKGDGVTTRVDRSARLLEAAVATFARNLLAESPDTRYFERTVVSNGPLSERGRAEFAKVVRERGEAFVLGLDTFLSKMDDSEVSDSGKHYGVGVYFFEQKSADQQTGKFGMRGFSDQTSGELEEIDVLDSSKSNKAS